MRSSGKPPHFTDEEIKVHVGKWPVQASKVSLLQGLVGLGPHTLGVWVSCVFFHLHQAFNSRGWLLMTTLSFVFSPTPFIALHQGMSAPSCSLPSMGKSNPCKPRIPSKTRCSSAVIQATKCWRYRVLPEEGWVSRLEEFPRASQGRRASRACPSPTTVFPSFPTMHQKFQPSENSKRVSQTLPSESGTKVWAKYPFSPTVSKNSLNKVHQAYRVALGQKLSF